jgi:tetratricopeptide (TPR) repeat protein
VERVIPGGNGISCPDETVWLEVAAGLTPSGVETEKLLSHAAVCPDCAAALARSVRTLSSDAVDGEDTTISKLKSSGAKWQRRTAEMIAGPAARRSPWKKPLPVWLAAAATVAIGGVLIWRLSAPQAPSPLLAKAYTEQRTVELRIPGADYAPLRLQRGSRGSRADRPAELSEADAAIRRHLDANPSDPLWLWTKGRADVLDWSYDDAIRTLSLAFDLDASAGGRVKAEILIDLATAYFQRAEVEKNRAIDYNMAAEKLGQAIQYDPSLAVAFFNRALVYEKLLLYPAAIGDWNHYLSLDSHGSWADEARGRLAELERKMKAASPEGDRLNDLAEFQLDQAMAAGLASGSLNALAAKMSEENHDLWLSDALQSPPSEARSILKAMVDTRDGLRLDQFPGELDRLQKISVRGLTDPDRAWLGFEILFRTTHSPQVAHCVEGVDDVIALCRRRHYAWFLSWILQEQSTCVLAAGDLAGAEAIDREAVKIAKEHRLPVTRLRAAGFLVDRMTNAGQYREAADLEQESLELFWSRPFPVARSQQFYNEMDFASEALGRLHMAMVSAQMAAEMAHAGKAIISEAVNRARWAGSAERLGLRDEAAGQYARSKALFDQLERNPSTDEYRAYAETFAAMSSGDRGILASLQSGVGRSTNPYMVIPYLRTMADFDVRDGNLALAQSRLEDAIRRMESNPAPHSRGEKRRQRIQLQRVYRQLVLAKLKNRDEIGAYLEWQRMLKADDELQGLSPAAPEGASSGAPAVMLTFARLDNRYGLWVRREGQPTFRWIDGDAVTIDRLARQFSALCSQSKTAMPELSEVGGQLRSKLLDFALTVTPAGSVLLVQPDGDLARVPWAALPLSSGTAIAARYLVATAPLPVADTGVLRLPNTIVRKALIAGAPMLDPILAVDYPPLPDVGRELDAVREAYPNSDLLTGRAATATNIDRYLHSDDALHFTGHAAVTADGIRLLTAPDSAATDHEAAEGFWKPGKDGLRLGLAVLSACSTARYEDVESPEPRDLAGALLLGGARQVVATLWNVDSEASTRFMEAFYGEMHKGSMAPYAMQKAWRTVTEQPGMANPYYWAGFSLFVQI